MSRYRFDGVGRFNQRYELDSIFNGTQYDLQQYEGQNLPWFLFDRADSHEDSVYDTGDSRVTGGRRWHKPILLPVVSVQRTEGAYSASSEGGLYTTDRIHVVVSLRQAVRAGIPDLASNADAHLTDRFLWNNNVFSPNRVQERGLLQDRWTVVGIDAEQVNPDELVNDLDFAQYAQPPA